MKGRWKHLVTGPLTLTEGFYLDKTLMLCYPLSKVKK